MNRLEHLTHAEDRRSWPRAGAAAALLIALVAFFFAIPSAAERPSTPQASQANAVRPIRALYVTGGAFHDFAKMETIVPPAIAKRVKVAWTIDHTAGQSTEALIERHR